MEVYNFKNTWYKKIFYAQLTKKMISAMILLNDYRSSHGNEILTNFLIMKQHCSLSVDFLLVSLEKFQFNLITKNF